MTSNMQRGRRIGRLLFGVSVLVAIASTLTVSASVRYVDLNNGSPAPPFTNWTAAATNIQDAIDAADAGDEIVVTNGVYQTGGRVVSGAMTNRVAVTKPVTLRSVNGPGVTVIKGYQVPGSPYAVGAVRCVYLVNGGTLTGFTLTGGAADFAGDTESKRCGGGVWCESTNAVVSNCVLTNNYAFAHGGGAYHGTLNNCILTGNYVGSYGGGAYAATLNNCVLTANSAQQGGGAYGAVPYGEPCFLNNCTLTANEARNSDGGGASGSTLKNCIAYYNNAPTGPNFYGGTLNYCCTTPLAESGTGNFTNTPMFTNYAGGDLRLQTGSPCINAGNNNYAVGTTDVAGQPRIFVGTVDVGAYEFQGPYILTGLTAGGGSLAIEPPSSSYFSNALVTVTATPAPGWVFLQWLGDATGTNPVVNLSMTRSKTVRAVFGTMLNTTAAGSGSIVVSPVSPLYPYGSKVRCTAVPTTVNYLDRWMDDATGQTNNPLTFTITNANPTVAALFLRSLDGALSNAVTVIPNGRGQVTLTPSGNLFQLNTDVSLQATPEDGQEFLGWSGDASGKENPLVVTVNRYKVITATFTKRPWLQGEGNPDLLSQDGFRLTLTGEFGAAYEFFGSTDLNGWSPLGIVTNAWGTVQFTDGEAATNAHRVYRAVLLP